MDEWSADEKIKNEDAGGKVERVEKIHFLSERNRNAFGPNTSFRTSPSE